MREALLYHLYSGHLYFTAAALFILGVSVKRVRLFVLLAIPLAALSGTPTPLWIALPVVGLTVAHIAFPDRQDVAMLAVAAVGVAAGFELPYHVTRPLPTPRHIVVIGDSLASGGFGERIVWPALLGRRLGIGVTNLSRPSERLSSAAESLDIPETDCVLLEIGGNDMLEGLPPRRFAADLERLLSPLKPARIVMLELPLPPGRWRYGAAQRRLARKYDAVLVPKRLLAGVLLDRTSTSDGLHLTQRGHDSLARRLRPFFETQAAR